jgi:hypothetical protein
VKTVTLRKTIPLMEIVSEPKFESGDFGYCCMPCLFRQILRDWTNMAVVCESLWRYGYLDEYPMGAYREHGLTVLDNGHHRMIASLLFGFFDAPVRIDYYDEPDYEPTIYLKQDEWEEYRETWEPILRDILLSLPQCYCSELPMD